MSSKNVNVDEWTDLFRRIGLSDDDMIRWHREFESRHPNGHQGFLEWLGLPDERIASIRAESSA